MRYALKLENSNSKKFLFNINNYLLLIIVLYIVEIYLLQFFFTFLSLCQNHAYVLYHILLKTDQTMIQLTKKIFE